MNKKVSLSSMIVLMCIAVLLTFMITFVSTANRYSAVGLQNSQDAKYLSKLLEVDKKVKEIYLNDIDEEKLSDSIIDGYIKGIGDKYASYLPKTQFENYMIENGGQMVGIGVNVIYDNERQSIEVISVMDDSPAKEGGILPGDFIYKVGDEYIYDLGYYTAIEKIKGKEGTDVTITVVRPTETSGGEEISMTLTRKKVNNISAKGRLIGNDIGYVRITEFNKQTPNEFIKAMEELQSQGAKKYIFDVRYNPGGDLEGIVATLDYLLPEGPIIRIVYKDGHETVRNSDAKHFEAPMVVLTNKHTASAAELFSSALRDYEIATLIGETTYGKGTVQSVMKLPDNSGISISHAMYNPPFGENYEGIGVKPHIEVLMPEDLKTNFYKLTDEEDVQLQAAINNLSK